MNRCHRTLSSFGDGCWQVMLRFGFLWLLLAPEVFGDFQGSTHLVELETEVLKYSKEATTGPRL